VDCVKLTQWKQNMQESAHQGLELAQQCRIILELAVRCAQLHGCHGVWYLASKCGGVGHGVSLIVGFVVDIAGTGGSPPRLCVSLRPQHKGLIPPCEDKGAGAGIAYSL
jgi:hypothetical protein